MVSLRHRKRAAAMERIQDEAFGLLGERGFEATRITDIAERAEVSPSTVYRYFGTKEGVFVWDPLAEPFTEALERHLETRPPMDAVELAFLELAEALDEAAEETLRERTRIVFATPPLRNAMRLMFGEFSDELARALASSGVPRLDARVAGAAIAAGLIVGIEHWADSSESLQAVAEETLRALRLSSP